MVNQPKIYIASSWRNPHYLRILDIVRGAMAAYGADEQDGTWGVYDFRNANGYFKWEQIDPNWENWTTEEYDKALKHPEARRGFANDYGAMRRATAMILVGPCGRSAHLELGWAAGAGIRTAVYLPERQEPELMYKLCEEIIWDPIRLVDWVQELY